MAIRICYVVWLETVFTLENYIGILWLKKGINDQASFSFYPYVILLRLLTEIYSQSSIIS